MLEVQNISIEFGGLKALDNISLTVDRGQILGLIGPNGAGKTTLFNIITSHYKPTNGDVLVFGKSLMKLKPNESVLNGVARTFQNIRLFSSMSVLDNVLIGAHSLIHYTFFETFFRVGRFFKAEQKAKKRALEILDYLDIAKYKDVNATDLSYGNQRKVEIARALATSPTILLLDEPAAGMNPKESENLRLIVEKIRYEFRLSILIIEHDMKFVNKLCKNVVVLDYGKKIFNGKLDDALKDKDVVLAYLGDSYA